MKQLGSHQFDEIIVTEWEARDHAQVFRDVAHNGADGCEDENAAQTIVPGSIEERKGHRGEHIEGHNGCAWNRGGCNLENPRARI